VFLPANHDGIFEVEVDENHDLALARLENGVFDVGVDDVHGFAPA